MSTCKWCADDDDETAAPAEPVVLAAVCVDLLGAFRAQSDAVPLDAAQASTPIFEAPDIGVSGGTLTGQRLLDVLGNRELAELSGLTLTALAGTAGAALEPVGTARLPLSQIGMSGTYLWLLRMLRQAATGTLRSRWER
jgi:hypothetical protein